MIDEPRRPRVSVITPTYNRRGFLPAAIESVFAQTFTDVELIVLDDGSTDDTISLLEEWAEREPTRFRWDTHDNMGQVRTVNKGFAMARGDYLYILNSDDYLYPECLERLVAGLEEHRDAVLAFGDYRVIGEDDQVLLKVELRGLSTVDIVRNMIPVGAGVIYTRRIVDANNGWNPEYSVMPDFEFWLKSSLIGPFIHVPGYAAVWRMHGEAITVRSKGHEDIEQFLRLYEWYFSQDELPEEIRAVESEAYGNLYIVCGTRMFGSPPKPSDRFVLLDRWWWSINADLKGMTVEHELLNYQEAERRLFEVDAMHLQQLEDERAHAGRLADLDAVRLQQLADERAHAGRLEDLAALRLRELEIERTRNAELAAQVQSMSLRNRLLAARSTAYARLRHRSSPPSRRSRWNPKRGGEGSLGQRR